MGICSSWSGSCRSGRSYRSTCTEEEKKETSEDFASWDEAEEAVEKAVEETAETADAEEAVEEVIKEEKEDEDTEEE